MLDMSRHLDESTHFSRRSIAAILHHMIRICIIGAGSHSRVNHGPSIRDLQAERPEEVEATAVCDLDEEKARSYAEDFHFSSVYTDIGRMIDAEKPDAIVLISPVDLTVRLVEKVSSFGAPMLIEKPPGKSVAETEHLRSLLAERRVPHMVSFNRRFSPAIIAAREWVETEASSAPRFIAGRMFRVRRLEADFVMGTGIHLTDTMMSLLGSCDRVEANRWKTERGGQCASCRVINHEGPDGSLLILPDTGLNEETYEIFGDRYRVLVSTHSSTVCVEQDGKTLLERSFTDSPEYVSGGALNETRAFVEAVEGKSEFRPTLDEAIESMRLAEAIAHGTWR